MPLGRMPESTRRFWMGPRHAPGPITSLITRPMVCMAGSNSQPSRPSTERPTHQEQTDRLEFLHARTPLRGQQAREHAAAVEGRNGQQVEQGQKNVDQYSGLSHGGNPADQRFVAIARAQCPRARRTTGPPWRNSQAGRRAQPRSRPDADCARLWWPPARASPSRTARRSWPAGCRARARCLPDRCAATG